MADQTPTENTAQLLSQGPAGELNEVGAHGAVTKEEIAAAKEKLEKYKTDFGFVEPERAFTDDPNIEWRFGAPPNYTLANLTYFEGKYKNHKPGSLELIVENLVKSWEFESSHKKDVNAWNTIDQSENFQGFAANGWKRFTKQEMIEAGNYNVLMQGCPKEAWDSEKVSWTESHDIFRKAMPAFAWEVIDVFSGPPVVGFSWHHFGKFEGEYKGNKGNGDWVHLEGFATAEVTADLKLNKVDIYYDPVQFLEVLEGKRPMEESKKFSGCPFANGASGAKRGRTKSVLSNFGC